MQSTFSAISTGRESNTSMTFDEEEVEVQEEKGGQMAAIAFSNDIDSPGG